MMMQQQMELQELQEFDDKIACSGGMSAPLDTNKQTFSGGMMGVDDTNKQTSSSQPPRHQYVPGDNSGADENVTSPRYEFSSTEQGLMIHTDDDDDSGDYCNIVVQKRTQQDDDVHRDSIESNVSDDDLHQRVPSLPGEADLNRSTLTTWSDVKSQRSSDLGEQRSSGGQGSQADERVLPSGQSEESSPKRQIDAAVPEDEMVPRAYVEELQSHFNQVIADYIIFILFLF